MQFMVYCAYRAKLEIPFLEAELASAWASHLEHQFKDRQAETPPASSPDKPKSPGSETSPRERQNLLVQIKAGQITILDNNWFQLWYFALA